MNWLSKYTIPNINMWNDCLKPIWCLIFMENWVGKFKIWLGEFTVRGCCTVTPSPEKTINIFI